MDDSLLQNLPLMTEPQGIDLLFSADASAGYAPKRLPLETAMLYVLTDNPAFALVDEILTLKGRLDCGGFKITNLAGGAGDSDAVNYAQIKDMILPLTEVSPERPGVSEIGNYLRVSTSTITAPFGGFYLFYWCVDTQENTEMSISGGSVVASSGATVNFDGSVANIVNVIKNTGWVGKYFHVACRYRNIKYFSPLSPTGHKHILAAAYTDVVTSNKPPAAATPSLSIIDNALCLTAQIPGEALFGQAYRAEILLDNDAETEITGAEPGLITLHSSIPSFRYDIPISKGKYDFAHARIVSTSLANNEEAGDTLHTTLVLDSDLIDDSFLNFLALKMSERMQTQQGEPLKPKE